MKKRIYIKFLFIIYIICLINIIVFKVDFPTITELYNKINLIPFYGDSLNLMKILLNIVIFIPFGIYLEILNKNKDIYNILFTFILIILLEISKYSLGTGIFDITNFITNTLGTYTGIILFKIIKSITNKKYIDNISLLIVGISTYTVLIYTFIKNVYAV